jgi:hypothetical protein
MMVRTLASRPNLLINDPSYVCIGIEATKLYATRREVAHENQEKMRQLKGPEHFYRAYDDGDVPLNSYSSILHLSVFAVWLTLCIYVLCMYALVPFL